MIITDDFLIEKSNLPKLGYSPDFEREFFAYMHKIEIASCTRIPSMYLKAPSWSKLILSMISLPIKA